MLQTDRNDLITYLYNYLCEHKYFEKDDLEYDFIHHIIKIPTNKLEKYTFSYSKEYVTEKFLGSKFHFSTEVGLKSDGYSILSTIKLSDVISNEVKHEDFLNILSYLNKENDIAVLRLYLSEDEYYLSFRTIFTSHLTYKDISKLINLHVSYILFSHEAIRYFMRAKFNEDTLVSMREREFYAQVNYHDSFKTFNNLNKEFVDGITSSLAQEWPSTEIHKNEMMDTISKINLELHDGTKSAFLVCDFTSYPTRVGLSVITKLKIPEEWRAAFIQEGLITYKSNQYIEFQEEFLSTKTFFYGNSIPQNLDIIVYEAKQLIKYTEETINNVYELAREEP